MQPTVGEVLEGKVTGITKFGAFVSLPDGNSGLVHISEIANSFVNDVHEHVSEGQTVKVKVIGINDAGKINLSIRRAEPPQSSADNRQNSSFRRTEQPRQQNGQYQRPANHQPRQAAQAPSGDSSFEDKLKQFMQDSDSRISSSRMYADKKSGSRRRKD